MGLKSFLREKKLAIGVLALAGILGTVGYPGKTYETDSYETYQGYTRNGGQNFLVFDEKTLKERGIYESPNYALAEDPGMYRHLEIGKKYKLEIREPTFSKVFPKRLLSFKECQDSD